MVNARMLLDFMIRFDLTIADVKIGSDGHNIWFKKPSGEQWPLEFSLFEDGSYEITIFKDNVYENGDGEHVILEKGTMMEVKNETNIQSHAKNA